MNQHVAARVPEGLRPFIATLAGYRVVGLPAGTHVGLPSRTITLVLPIDEPLTITVAGRARLTLSTLVGGLHDRPVLIHHDGHQVGIQAALTPRGVRALLGAPASELAGLAIGLDELLGRTASSLPERLADIPDWAGRFALVAEVLTGRLAGRAPWPAARSEVDQAWHLLARHDGDVAVGRIADRIGWSTEHLTTQFHREYGLRPKAAARVMRFEKSARLMRTGLRLSDVAAGCGYADQAHLIWEWRVLAGLTPGHWQQDDVLANLQDAVAEPAPH